MPRWKRYIVLGLVGLLAACSSGLSRDETVYPMGTLATVGPLNYNVLETEWLTQIGDSLNPRVPKHKFLLIRLTISNSGNQQVAVPLLHLEDAQGNRHLEVSDAAGVSNWLGLLRILEPGPTMQGVIVFDVPASSYRLRVTDGGDLESERTALVEIPLTLTAPVPLEPPRQPGQAF